MTASELIEFLKTLHPDIRIMVNGYEGGLDDPTPSMVIEVELNCIDSDVYGSHAKEGEGWVKGKEIVKAVVMQTFRTVDVYNSKCQRM